MLQSLNCEKENAEKLVSTLQLTTNTTPPDVETWETIPFARWGCGVWVSFHYP